MEAQLPMVSAQRQKTVRASLLCVAAALAKRLPAELPKLHNVQICSPAVAQTSCLEKTPTAQGR